MRAILKKLTPGISTQASAELEEYFAQLYECELKEPFKRHANDTGSSEVQIAALTARLDYLKNHLKDNRKDIKARLHAIKLGLRRRRLLGYLYRTRRDLFDRLIETFGIQFDDTAYSYKKLLPKFDHLHHRHTKRYTSAKEAREDKARQLAQKQRIDKQE
ncbi:bifunctional Ribosomal protein S15 [Babesia duncani]|uniref:Bifunctional Ribosomal protein S15 n=1 Tax=Babesia duncani TaxID=323732 RepID=A0AAD9PKE7_9APIC|nr:bifunctional Ribosomal protein S15 [Babesia duncani]